MVGVRIDLTSPHQIKSDEPGTFKTVSIVGEDAAQLADYELHKLDLEQTLAALASIGQMPDVYNSNPSTETLVSGVLSCGAFITYCRCFDSARRFRLDPSTVFRDANPVARVVHDQVWIIRNKHYGHDVNDARRSIVTAALDESGRLIGIGTQSVQAAIAPQFLRDFERVVRIALDHVASQTTIIEAAIVARVSAMTAEERLALGDAVLPAVTTNFAARRV